MVRALKLEHPVKDGETVRAWSLRLLADKSIGRQLLERWR
jgi:hypothetical protein